MDGPRQWGLGAWRLQPGARNTICDVRGVRVGHRTIRQETPHVARTGVTVVLPDADLPRERLPAAAVVFNGTGEMTGFHQVNEWGMIETPIALTGTAGVPMAMEGLARHMFARSEDLGRTMAPCLPVVAECNDMYLSDARHCPLRPEHVLEAIAEASDAQASWGDVGAGTGMVSFGLKGGIGSASRCVEIAGRTYHVGALCLVNFGQPGDLTVCGRALGHLPGEVERRRQPVEELPDGSLVVILATDAPLDHLLLRRLARRAALGMARVGSYGRHGSGDLFLAFSAEAVRETDGAPLQTRTVLHTDYINDFFLAAVESTEEGILTALFSAHDADGVYGHTVRAAPLAEVRRRVLRA